MLVDDRRSAVALPETPLLAVLPGTGGLTRVTDKRKVRRDRADVFCSTEEGMRGAKAVEWRLVDEVVPKSKWKDAVAARAHEIAARSDRPEGRQGHQARRRSTRKIDGDRVSYSHVDVEIDRARGARHPHRARAVAEPCRPRSKPRMRSATQFWPLAVARELEDAILHLRSNEPAIGVVLLRTEGDAQAVLAHDDFLAKASGDWLMREIRHYLKRVLKRLDVTPKSLIALIEPGSCFAGTLAELAFAADRSLMLIGTREGDNRPPAAIALGARQFRLLSDGQRPDAACRRASSASRRRSSALKGKIGAAARGARRRPSSASSPWPTRISTGTTNCA